MENFLVTGGFGFLGGHLLELLLREHPDALIHVVDDLSSNPIPHEMLLEELGNPKNLTFDICTIEDFLKKPSTVQWSGIYHLASIVGPAGVLKHAGRIIRSVVGDTYGLMELASKSGCRLLDVSTSEIYGGGREGYCSEEMPKIIQAKTTVRLEYAIAKLAAETALINSARIGHLDTVIVRPFNISGPRQSGVGGFVLPRFVAFALMDLPLTVFGKGDQVRAFTHVRDMVSGIHAAMLRGKSGEAYNLGNPKNKTTIDNLADLVLDVTGSKAGKVYIDPKKIYGDLYEEANDKYPDADRAIRELKWVPEHSARQVVEDTVAYMRKLPENLLHQFAGKK